MHRQQKRQQRSELGFAICIKWKLRWPAENAVTELRSRVVGFPRPHAFTPPCLHSPGGLSLSSTCSWTCCDECNGKPLCSSLWTSRWECECEYICMYIYIYEHVCICVCVFVCVECGMWLSLWTSMWMLLSHPLSMETFLISFWCFVSLLLLPFSHFSYCCCFCCCCLGWCNFLLVIFVSLCYAFSSNWNLIEMFVICGRQPSSNRTLSHTFCCCQISAATSSASALLSVSASTDLPCVCATPSQHCCGFFFCLVVQLPLSLPFSPSVPAVPLLHFSQCFVYLLCGLLPLLLCAQLDI